MQGPDLRTLLTLICGVGLAASFFDPSRASVTIAVIAGSYFAIRTAWQSVVGRELDVNLLMVLAAAGAIAVDFFGAPGHEPGSGVRDAAALLFLFSLSNTLESYAMARTRSAIEGLVRLRPSQALLVRGGVETKVPVEQIAVGDLVRVPPFEPVPLDGEVVEGQSSSDQSAMTGESTPVTKAPGDALMAGTTNLEGALLMRATSTVGSSTLDRIVELVREAQDNKASGERVSAWFGQRYTFFVVGAFVASLLLRTVFGQAGGTALYQSLTLLVALSPCALVISTPASTLSALAWAGRKGVLIRGGQYIETAGKVEILAIDKTGTLTTGRPRLCEICVCHGAAVTVGAERASCEDEHACWREGKAMSSEALVLLRAAASAEQYSHHPVADAIRRAATESGIDVPEAIEHGASPGMGVTALVENKRVMIGQRRYLESEGVELPQDFARHLESLQRDGMTVAVLSFDGQLAAFGFADTPREGAKAFLDSIAKLGVKRVVMLTGDTPETAGWVARSLGIEEYEAGLLPDEKTASVARLNEQGTTMMVGDGVNDAPSLARASVGVAMGGLGSDVALNAADVVLMHDRLERLPELIRLGRKTNGIVRANLVFAAGVVIVLTALSLTTGLPLPVAVIGHEGSTVLVILNGLRLLRGP